MLACDGAAHGHTGFQNFGAKQFTAVHLIGVVGIKQNKRVQVAIARVKYIGAAQLVFLFHLGNGQQNVGQSLARNGGVHAHVVGADAARCRERIFTATPKTQALGFVFADGDGGGARPKQDIAHAANFFFNFFWCAIAFTQQNSCGVQVITCVHKIFYRCSHGLVHHF